jgi:hypothetical protein
VRVVFDEGMEWNTVVYTVGESISYKGLADAVEEVGRWLGGRCGA